MVKTQKVIKDSFGEFVEDTRQYSTKQSALIKQRDDVEELTWKGFNRDQIAHLLGIDARTVDRRRAERRTENLAFFEVGSASKRKEKAADFEAEYRLIKQKLWSIHASASSDKDKIAAIHGVLEANRDKIKIMQMLGYLPKEGTMLDDLRPMTVIFGSMKRPDRRAQLAEKEANEKRLQERLNQN